MENRMNRLRIQKNTVWLVFIIIIMICMAKCSGTGLVSEKQVLEQVFIAIKTSDWNKYQQLIITTADISMKRLKLSDFQAQQSYLGSSLKPREQQKQRQQFDEVIRNTNDEKFINFKQAEFIDIGSLINSGTGKLIEGGEYSYNTYSMRLKINGQEIDTKHLQPKFVLIKYEKEYRLLKLKI